jgi:hypothetical protein
MLASTQHRLDLSEHFVLLLYPGGAALVDQRPPHECSDAPCWFWRPFPDVPPMALYSLFEARARRQDGEWLAPAALRPEPVHEAYGNRVIQASVSFGDGLEEDWTLRVDPLQVGFDWIRQPAVAGSQCAFHIYTPALDSGLQFWQTDNGVQSIRCWNGAAQPSDTRPGDGQMAGAALFYNENPRGALRVQTVTPASMRVAMDAPLPAGVAGAMQQGCWRLDWTVLHGQLIHFTGHAGMHSAARRHSSYNLGNFADASVDFGHYYMEAVLSGLSMLSDPHGLPRAASLCPPQDQPTAALDEIALAAESLGVCAPQWLAMLLRRTMERYLELPASLPVSASLGIFPEAAPGLLLMMAGRYLRLTGDIEFITAHAPAMRVLAESLLALRRPGEALPSFSQENGPQVKQAGSTAVVSAGLSRWGVIEERLGDATQSKRYGEAAMAMQWAAMAPVQTGGLWHLGRGTFVRYRLSVDELQEDPEDLPGAEYHHGQQLLAFWLGLCPDEEHIRRAYEYVDYTYTYAAGRGGPEYPPGFQRSFHALIDVLVRARHGCGDVESIFQRALDQGARGGMPFALHQHGAPVPAGTLLDNAPYFEMVLHQHYGLDYDAGGWRLFTPRPLANYPLTRVTNLRHRNALYAITWQGRGAIQRVTINGAPHPSRVLDKTTGEHEVVVTLG